LLLENAAIQGSNPFLDYAKFDGKVSIVYRTEQFIDYIKIEKNKLFLFCFAIRDYIVRCFAIRDYIVRCFAIRDYIVGCFAIRDYIVRCFGDEVYGV
jgi:hypothetical protein